MPTDAPTGYDPVIALLGSIMFCAVPLAYLAFKLMRKLRWREDDPRAILGGVLSGFGWFAFFLLWLGPIRGLYFAIAALTGWGIGIWWAVRRNARVVRSYHTSRPRKSARAQEGGSKP